MILSTVGCCVVSANPVAKYNNVSITGLDGLDDYDPHITEAKPFSLTIRVLLVAKNERRSEYALW